MDIIDPNKPQRINTVPKQTHLDLIRKLTVENEALRKRLNEEIFKNQELTKRINEEKGICQQN